MALALQPDHTCTGPRIKEVCPCKRHSVSPITQDREQTENMTKTDEEMNGNCARDRYGASFIYVTMVTRSAGESLVKLQLWTSLRRNWCHGLLTRPLCRRLRLKNGGSTAYATTSRAGHSGRRTINCVHKF